MNDLLAANFEDIAKSAERISNYIYKTPILVSHEINEKFGANFFFKCENLQRTGSFKFRGAINALKQLNSDHCSTVVATFSSGNHAKAMAMSSKILNVKSIILMPLDAPLAKLESTRKYANKVILYDRYVDKREKLLKNIVETYGAIPISSYDDYNVILGAGTVCKEFFEEIKNLDAIFIGLGGGGLLAGSSLIGRKLASNCKIYGVEPQFANDGQQSFNSGKLVKIETPKTIADGAQTQCLGKKTFNIIKKYVDDIVTVTDDQIIEGMKIAANYLKLIVEPTGCLGLAAAINNHGALNNKNIGVILTGSNIDMERFCYLTNASSNQD
ncbi:threonine dehydratase [Candidatus Kinetoplastibacterium blastocrithidii TCC012E]|uniref:Serine/threonine dehydratase n=2 Tax=cellular organisms TaxID=131567 RepID=S9U5G7_9TRYP|nr:pyridoxal-phosphate dependent enzyme [Candidatus Kinetoplastibacterium blastocrithidii]AFZ83436.1 serine/threoninee dehydratase [Candidatus Kinetoplastibacterium blastocrithidii (ex Strigomonas culicis)]AGF49532.1 threonine dehydratase [Candidatus Kinetoplastibacterium blastocrithidii TCC012E]EPY24183.1 serine/threonine dehydratase [Strigomonas culicis]|eukprot:EPY24183.1 serine/threonine dehydratase [Strigomonas culicis]